MAILMCDNTLSVLFKDGACCNYPRTTAAHYHAMIASDPGKWLHRNLYRILPYVRIRTPCPPAGCGGAVVACCPGVQIPLDLHMTITNGGSAIDGSYSMTHTLLLGIDFWIPDTAIGSCSGTYKLFCNAGLLTSVWNLQDQGGNQLTPASAQCSPFDLVFTPVDFVGCGGDAFATVEITA